MANPRAVTYAELVDVLARLGYVPETEPPAAGYNVFRHPGRSLPVILQAFKARTPIRPIYLAGIRSILEESAPAEAAGFESWLETRTSRGVPVR
jgi:hypothetical protein